MAIFYCDSKDGDDGNGGVSWVDAVKSIAQLETLGSTTDSYNLMGRGSAYPYNCPAAGLVADRRGWFGYLTKGIYGGLNRFEGMPHLIASGSRLYNGPKNPHVVKDILLKSFDRSVNFLRTGGGFPENVVERCILIDCDEGVTLQHEANLIARYNVFFGNNIGLRDTTDPTAGNDCEIHHNTFCGNSRGYQLFGTSSGDDTTYDAWHSNIFEGNSIGAKFSVWGSITFNVAGEPNYNVWYNNTTDLDDTGQGISKGSNAINADPKFVDPTNEDYRLAQDSPALKSDGSSKNRGALGPGSRPDYVLRLGKFFAKDGLLIEAESLFRDRRLIAT